MSRTYFHNTIITEDGEVVGERTAKFYSPFQDGKGYNFKYKSTNTRSYLEIPLPEDFTDTEIGKIYRLSRCIYSDSNLIAKRSNNEIKAFSKKDIQAVVGLHRTKFNPFWNKVIDHGIISEAILGGVKYFCFNPLYFNSTTYIPLYLYITFREELNAHLPEWVIEKYLEMEDEKTE